MSKIKKWEIIVCVVLFAVIVASLIASTQIGRKKYFPQDKSNEDIKILFMGDSNFAYEFESISIPDIINMTDGYSAYNVAIGGASAAKSVLIDGRGSHEELFGFYHLSRIARTDNYQSVVAMESERTADEIDRVIYLTQIDLQEMDYIVISYGLNDYMAGIPIEGEDPFDERTYCGALRSGIRRLQKETDATIILASITYAVFPEEDGTFRDGYEVDFGGGVIADYRDATQKVASEFENIIFYDALSDLQIDQTNYEDYMFDIIHLNEKARMLYAKKLISVIEEK